jgi:KUP system potassium uptake protein
MAKRPFRALPILADARLPLDLFLAGAAKRKLPRVPGTAVFMTLSSEGTPKTLLHHMKHNHMLHEQVVLLSIHSIDSPVVPQEERLNWMTWAGFYRVIATYGYMQKPDVPEIMQDVISYGLITDPMTTTFYLGRETLLTGGESKMMRWRKAVFAFMSRNAGNPTAYFGIPANRVVELGAQIEL